MQLIFKVPNGFEDISVTEIREKLEILDPKVDFDSMLYSIGSNGIVLAKVPDFLSDNNKINIKTVNQAKSWWQKLESVSLYSVDSIGIQVAEIELTKDTFNNIGSNDHTLSFEQLLINSLSHLEVDVWLEYLNILGLKSSSNSIADPSFNEKELTFKVDFERNAFKHPKLKSFEMAGLVGASALKLSCEEKNLKVNLKDYDLLINAYLINNDKENGFAKLIIGLNKNNSLQKQRSLLEIGRTTLKSTIAYCLIKYASIKPYEMVLDPCCGVGTLPIEASNKYQKDAYYIFGDIEEASIETKAKRNLAISNSINGLFRWDARRLPLRNSIIDVVITDLPWGMREGSRNVCAKLYPKLMKELNRIVKIGGRIYLVTLDWPLLKRCLAYPHISKCWKLHEIRKVTIGFEVQIFHLERIQNE